MYKMIVSDLDESLLKSDGSVSTQDLATIAKLKQAGVKFVPNTGRGFSSVQPLLKALGTYQTPGQYVISYNGGAIVENQENKIIHQTALPFETASKIYRLAVQDGRFCAHVYTFHHVYVYQLNQAEQGYLANRGVAYQEIADQDLARFASRPIAKVIFQNSDHAVLEAFKQKVLAAVGPELTVTFSSNRYVEFNPAGIDKGDAAITLGQLTGVKPEEIIALGDNSNDLSMIRKCGLGVVVQNATPELKQNADLVLPVTNNQSPITAIYHQVFAEK